MVDSTSDVTVENTKDQAGQNPVSSKNIDILNDVHIVLNIEIGRTQIKIRDLLSLTKDSIIDLNKSVGEPVDIYANGKLISRGEIVTANGKYCVRLTSVVLSNLSNKE